MLIRLLTLKAGRGPLFSFVRPALRSTVVVLVNFILIWLTSSLAVEALV